MKNFNLSPLHLPPIKKARTITVKHSAAFTTIMGGISHYAPLLKEFEIGFFVLAGLIAIYEPYFSSEA